MHLAAFTASDIPESIIIALDGAFENFLKKISSTVKKFGVDTIL